MSDELKTPDEWSKLEGVEILDPDGWRGRNGRPWTDPITLAEFQERLIVCTQRRLPRASADVRAEFEANRAAGLAARHETRVERAREREELAALRALLWFMNDGMGFADSGGHASLTWAEVTELGDLHDAVEELYQRDGYPLKPSKETS